MSMMRPPRFVWSSILPGRVAAPARFLKVGLSGFQYRSPDGATGSGLPAGPMAPSGLQLLAAKRSTRYVIAPPYPPCLRGRVRASRRLPMAAGINRQILLKSRPDGAPGLDNFELVRREVPEPADGEVLMRTRYLSLDPYMRGRMSAAKSYAKPVEVGEPMVGGTVGEIVASRHPQYSAGDIVLGFGGW